MRIILLFFLFFSVVTHAQDTIVPTITSKDNIVESEVPENMHPPKKAALLSILPGAGQIYNHIAMPKGKKKAFWKVPIIYAGLGATGYFAIKNHIDQKALKEEYIFRSKYGVPNLSEYANYDDQGILTLFESKRTNRDLMIFGFIAVYGLNILDAFVEAHFVEFDVSKDLSMSIRPSLQDFHTPGISLNLKFR